MLFSKKTIFVVGFFILFFCPAAIRADSEGQTKDFLINSSFDPQQKTHVLATLQKASFKAYFYVDQEWWQTLSVEKQKTAGDNLGFLANEFDNVIYPKLTEFYGSEWKPGIDNDERITILFHRMPEGAAGYMRTDDEYPKLQDSSSNEREMVYVNVDYIFFNVVKSLLAHEFTHLIEFNQKTRLSGKDEDVWLSEMRAEYSPTLLGYDQSFQGSNLQNRVKSFLGSPNDSLTEWENKPSDYGVIAVFGQYLAEKYGRQILADSLHNNKTGIDSLNEALQKYAENKTLLDVFTNWTVAVFANDCSLGDVYCFRNANLQSIKVAPSLIYLPSTQKTEFSLSYKAPYLSGNWYRVMSAGQDLSVSFSGFAGIQFKIPYVLCQKDDGCSVAFLPLDQNNQAKLNLADFGSKFTALTLIPSVQRQIDGAGNSQVILYPFSLLAQSSSSQQQEDDLIKALLEQIAQLKAKIAQVQAELAKYRQAPQCFPLTSDLFFGQRSAGVSCLQQFLKEQGKSIYPEGIVSGYFGSLTKSALSRFQAKYSSEILQPRGLQSPTGVADSLTRAKINQLAVPTP